jgi:hypothetical protein
MNLWAYDRDRDQVGAVVLSVRQGRSMRCNFSNISELSIMERCKWCWDSSDALLYKGPLHSRSVYQAKCQLRFLGLQSLDAELLVLCLLPMRCP